MRDHKSIFQHSFLRNIHPPPNGVWVWVSTGRPPLPKPFRQGFKPPPNPPRPHPQKNNTDTLGGVCMLMDDLGDVFHIRSDSFGDSCGARHDKELSFSINRISFTGDFRELNGSALGILISRPLHLYTSELASEVEEQKQKPCSIHSDLFFRKCWINFRQHLNFGKTKNTIGNTSLVRSSIKIIYSTVDNLVQLEAYRNTFRTCYRAEAWLKVHRSL